MNDGPFRLSLGTLYDALIASMVTVASTCAHVAKALNAAEPTEPRTWESWLTSYDDNVLSVIDIGRFMRDNRDQHVGAYFPPTRTPTNNLAHLDRTARDWLTYWLLEIGTRNFETWLEGQKMPDWLRWPELV